MGTQNPELVHAINYDAARFDVANTMASEMSDLLSVANSYLYGDDKRKLISDKTCTQVEEVMDELLT